MANVNEGGFGSWQVAVAVGSLKPSANCHCYCQLLALRHRQNLVKMRVGDGHYGKSGLADEF